MLHFAQDDLMCRLHQKNGTQGAFFMVLKFRWRTLGEARVGLAPGSAVIPSGAARLRHAPVHQNFVTKNNRFQLIS